MWLFLISVLIIGFFIYKVVQQNSPEAKIKKLENLAEKFRIVVTEENEKNVERHQALLNSFENGKTKKYTITGQSKEVVEQILNSSMAKLNEINLISNNYVRLKEKHKHDDATKRVDLAEDYFDYYYIRYQIINQSKSLDYVSGDEDDSIFDTIKQLGLKTEEIVNRSNKQISA